MCVIFQLLPGYTLPKAVLANAVHNNPHGYGVIIKREGKITVVKELPIDGNDPEVIYKILKDNEDAERFVHVRWKTAGAISIENTQPFQVYNDRGREVWFCHNGTLNGFTPPYTHNQAPNPHEMSDSRKFAETILAKYLPKFMGENGIADYQDDVMQELLIKAWSHGSKGLLISNDLEPFFLGLSQWETIKTSEIIDGEEVQGSFFASNNDYFERLKRGPLHDRLEEEKRKKEQEEREARRAGSVVPFSGGAKGITPITAPPFSEKFSLGEGIVDLLEDFDLYKVEGYVALANVCYAEWMTYVDNIKKDDLASLLLYLTDFLKTHVENNFEFERKHIEYIEKIETLEKEIKTLNKRKVG